MCRCPSFLKFSLGAWEVFWNMPKLSAPCVRAAKNDPPTAPISCTACQCHRAFPKISKLTHAAGDQSTGSNLIGVGGETSLLRVTRQTFCVAAVNEQGAGWTALGAMPSSQRCFHPLHITARKEHHRYTGRKQMQKPNLLAIKGCSSRTGR